MTYFVVDVEADGPCPGLYSMVSFGVVKVDRGLKTSFFGQVRPISERWDPASLAISNVTRDEHQTYADPASVMVDFTRWLKDSTEGKDSIFLSDNPAFDWQFINYYFHAYTGSNPFGHSGRRITDIYCGLRKNLRVGRELKRLRQTKHTHHPVDDARGNAEAFLAMADQFGLNIGV